MRPSPWGPCFVPGPAWLRPLRSAAPRPGQPAVPARGSPVRPGVLPAMSPPLLPPAERGAAMVEPPRGTAGLGAYGGNGLSYPETWLRSEKEQLRGSWEQRTLWCGQGRQPWPPSLSSLLDGGEGRREERMRLCCQPGGCCETGRPAVPTFTSSPCAAAGGAPGLAGAAETLMKRRGCGSCLGTQPSLQLHVCA